LVEESKKDPMYAAYGPRVITKESLLTASPSQLEMLAPHVVLVKDPTVSEKLKPRYIPLFGFNAFNFCAQRMIRSSETGSSPGDGILIVNKDGKVEETATSKPR
jgi:hypothetical protein